MKYHRLESWFTFASATVLLALTTSSCDSDISGEAFSNTPPETFISVRDESLVDNLDEQNRLRSTVLVSWTGDDADGFIAGFEIRFFPSELEPDESSGWTFTVRNDSLILMPIPAGDESANVVFEVRSIDNEGAKDPTPARTVFPIRNSPPEIRFSQFDLPPDTTFQVVSFAWTASDPDGESNLKSIDISLNDSLSFASLAPDIAFVTLFAELDPGGVVGPSVEVRVFTGRGVQTTSIRLPDFRLDAENTFFIRAVDQAGAASIWKSFTWNVKRARSEVLFVNDYRIATAPTIQDYHIEILKTYLPVAMEIDVWDLSKPFATGSSGNTLRSNALPPNAEPSLRLMLSLFKYVYWISTNTTNEVTGNNLPFVAPVMNDFFSSGGKMIVHSPIRVPNIDSDFSDNAAVFVLPLTAPTVLPDSVGRLELRRNALVTATSGGSNLQLPELVSQRFFINLRPYLAVGANIEPLYNGNFLFRNIDGTVGEWPGTKTLASISLDNRVALFAFPLVDDQTGNPLFIGTGGDPGAAVDAVHRVLDRLGFPKR